MQSFRRQIVGLACALCREPIMVAPTGRFCSVCKSPVHLDCPAGKRAVVPADPCGGCGATVAERTVARSAHVEYTKELNRSVEQRLGTPVMQMVVGLGICLGGIAVTVWTYHMASINGGGVYVIWRGAIVVGFGWFLQGLVRLGSKGD